MRISHKKTYMFTKSVPKWTQDRELGPILSQNGDQHLIKLFKNLLAPTYPNKGEEKKKLKCLVYMFVEVRGDPHEVFRPREGG